MKARLGTWIYFSSKNLKTIKDILNSFFLSTRVCRILFVEEKVVQSIDF